MAMIVNKICPLFFGIFSLLIVFKPTVALTNQSGDLSSNYSDNSVWCMKCHNSVYNSMKSFAYQHPNADNSCKTCHIRKKETNLKNIRISSHGSEAVLLLAGLDDSSSYQVKVDLMNSDGEKFSKELTLTLSSINSGLPDNGKPPEIQNFQIISVQGGVFFTVNLGWETDEFSNSTVEYGRSIKYGSQHGENFNLYTKEHKTAIGGLVKGKNYYFRVKSTDLFGNTTLSDAVKVKMKKTFSKESDEADSALSVIELTAVKAGLKTALWWKGKNIEKAVITVSQSGAIEGILEKEPHYPGLTDVKFAGFDSCNTKNCHGSSKHSSLSHPDGRVQWSRAQPPSVLPLYNDMEIYCSTCHSLHGGNYMKILRLSNDAICSSCHDFDY